VTSRERARIRRLPAAGLALFLLVAVSISVRFIAALGLKSPWIAPDEMAYSLVGRAFWTSGHMQLLDGSSPSYGLFPVVAGLPLAVFGTADALVVLKALEAILMTSTAVVVYVWTSDLAGSRWALAAAGMTVALPAFAYSGLVMSETAFLPAATLALLLLSRALVSPSLRNQMLLVAGVLVAVAMRFQAVVLLPAIVVSIGLMAWFSRDRRLFRRFAPSLAVLGLLTLLWGIFSYLSASATFLGAYTVVGHGGYSFVTILRWIARHAGDAFLVVLGAPVVATLILGLGAARGRERDPRVRALLAVTLAYGPLLIVQVGIFASRFVSQLAERDLVTIGPPLFVVLAVWVHRGLPRPQPASSIVALVAVAPALFLPVDKLVNTYAVPSAFMTIPLLDLAERTSAATLRFAWLTGAVALVALTLLIPRRAGPALVLLVAFGLGATSVLAQKRIDRRASADRREFFGTSSTQWIDRAAKGDVAYLDDEDPLWNAAWHVAFWNQRVRSVATLGQTAGPLPGAVAVSALPDGRLVRGDGSPLHERFVVTRKWVTLDGQRLKRIAQGRDEPGLTLWRTPSDPAVSTWTQGVLRRGDVVQPVTVTVFDCRVGRLELTLLPKQGLPTVSLSVVGLQPVTVPLPANSILQGWIPAPPSGGEKGKKCVFEISPQGLVETTGIVFKRGSTPAVAAASRREANGRTMFVQAGSVALHRQENIAYCVGGAFQVLPAGQYPGATAAIFVSGSGLTCDHPPEGYRRKGFASTDLGVPAHTYAFYAP
jgi:hypothetical protein